jgi:predicted transcriptional regulator
MAETENQSALLIELTADIASAYVSANSVADAAQGLPAGVDGAALLLRLARQRPLEHDQSPAAHGRTRGRWSPGLDAAQAPKVRGPYKKRVKA